MFILALSSWSLKSGIDEPRTANILQSPQSIHHHLWHEIRIAGTNMAIWRVVLHFHFQWTKFRICCLWLALFLWSSPFLSWGKWYLLWTKLLSQTKKWSREAGRSFLRFWISLFSNRHNGLPENIVVFLNRAVIFVLRLWVRPADIWSLSILEGARSLGNRNIRIEMPSPCVRSLFESHLLEL